MCLKEIFGFVCEEFDAIFKNDIPNELVSKRYELVKKFDGESFSVKELNVLCDVRIFLDFTIDFYETALVKQMEGLSRQ